MIKPSSPEEMFKELEKIPEQMAEELGTKALESIEAKVRGKLEEAVAKRAAKVLAKQGLIRVGSLLPLPNEAISKVKRQV